MLELKIGSGGEPMGWFEWSASIVASLAWPLAVVFVAIIYRTQISGLLTNIRSLTWGDKTLNFTEKLDRIEDASRGGGSGPPMTMDDPQAVEEERFERLLEISPAAAVLDAWLPVEARLLELGRTYLQSSKKLKNDPLLSKMTMQPKQVIAMLGSRKLAGPNVISMLLEMQNLRNAAAHHGDVTAVDAVRFRDLARFAIFSLEGVTV